MTVARSRTTAARTLAAVVLGVLLAAPLALVQAAVAPDAAEASTYRYWTYWWGDGSGKKGSGWSFAPQGPAAHPLGDEWVLGWRFSTTSTTGGARPRQSSSFDSLCPGLSEPVAGSVRVALVIDYGSSSDAPPGQSPPVSGSVRRECLTLPAPARGVAALNAAGVSVRSEKGLICALDGYPRGECAPIIADPPAPSKTPKPSPTRTSARPTASATSARPSSTPASGEGTSSASSAATSTTASAPATPTPTGSPTGEATPTAAPPSDPPQTAEETLPAVAGAPASAETPSSSPIGFVVGGLVVASLAGSAWWSTRRGGAG